MNTIIKKIALFKGGNEKRIVDLDSGLNIITGDSKTGKSALIEIVDYCLFAKQSTIPKGKITEFADYFSVVLKVEDKYLIIARPSAKNESNTKAFFSVELNDKFLEDFSFGYFKGLTLRRINGDVQNEVERHLGLSVADTRSDEEDDKRNGGKASLRNFVTLLFQHQNLIANKHSLFYRFDDTYKRKATIDQLPVFLGWVDGEYYSLFRELKEKEKELKAEIRLRKRLSKDNNELKNLLFTPISQYYSIIGKTLDADITLAELKSVGKDLPIIPFSAYTSRDLELEVSKKEQERLKAQTELSEIEKTLRKLDENASDSQKYAKKISAVNATISNDNFDELHCPMCNSLSEEVSASVASAINSKIRLRTELEKTGTYVNDMSEQLVYLKRNRDKLKVRIRHLTSDIELLRERDQSFKKGQSLRDQAMIMKGLIEATLNQILEQNKLSKTAVSLTDLKDRIEYLKGKISGFDIPTKYKEADVFISKRMNQICDKLDFEEELRPGELKFDTEKFDFYYHKGKKEKILLSEMGSGANWLACHLSLFIALLHLSCREKDSCIPTFLFIDQPSQVYFPKEYKEVDENDSEGVEKLDENILQVKNIFKVLANEINVIKKDCGFFPQIVVMDHADEEEFRKYRKEKWSKNGKKLI